MARTSSPATTAQVLRAQLELASGGIVYPFWKDLQQLPATREILGAEPEVQVQFVLLTVDAVAAAGKSFGKGTHANVRHWNAFSQEGFPCAAALVTAQLLRKSLPWTAADIAHAVRRAADFGVVTTWNVRFAPALVAAVGRYVRANGLTVELMSEISRLSDAIGDANSSAEFKLKKSLTDLISLRNDVRLDGGAPWSAKASADIAKIGGKRAVWCDLLNHMLTANASTPTKKWLQQAESLIDQIGIDAFRAAVMTWFPLVAEPRSDSADESPDRVAGEEWMIRDFDADALKGLAWCCGVRGDLDLARALSQLAVDSYRKLPGVGPRLAKVGNACIWALGSMPGTHGISQLAILSVKVRFGTAQKLIDKALSATADRLGVSRDDICEMAVPTYGLTEVGIRRERMGEFSAELALSGAGAAEIRWLRSDDKPQRSIPAAVRTGFPNELKDLKLAARDIQKMLPAQRDRIDQLHLARKSWAYDVWRERYLDHPLVGVVARRLIWRFAQDGRTKDAIYIDGQVCDVEGRPLTGLGAETRVELWHPIGQPVEAIQAWRRRLEEASIRQPMKQAHREIYILTDAERNTRVYSNRFAAHILRQHQFNALCGVRGWKNKLRLMVDDFYPPATRLLPQWGLRAEFWIEGIGEDPGVDTNESSVFLRVATDQVRFYRLDAPTRTVHAAGGGYQTDGPVGSDEPIPLEDVPPLVFSEIMRDVDLFVGVASVGNDPRWSDGGPEGRYRDYWNAYSFGELGETAQTRRAVLERLIPRLAIASRCSFLDRFLVVRGDLRTYKIHLGSGNILMEPNDQYLCIVPAAGAARGAVDKVYLPFEGDERLAVILSKALMLAADARIADSTITTQIRRSPS